MGAAHPLKKIPIIPSPARAKYQISGLSLCQDKVESTNHSNQNENKPLTIVPPLQTSAS
jgi:hypothetical protein